jgi:hypothetical protein
MVSLTVTEHRAKLVVNKKKSLLQSSSVQRLCFFIVIIRTYSVWVEGQLIAQPCTMPAPTKDIALKTDEGASLWNEVSLIKNSWITCVEVCAVVM